MHRNVSPSIYRSLLAFAILVATLEAVKAQQRFAYVPEPQQTHYARNYQANQQQPFEEPTQETFNRRRNRMPVYNANPHQISYHQNNQPNQNLQNGSVRGASNHRQQSTQNSDRNQNKCRIWIPAEVVEKYPLASKIQVDQQQTLTLIETCCKDFTPIKWRGSTICRPVCENCQNGFCSAPGECQCFEGFVKNDNDDCVFTCPLGCLNGKCYLDGTCKCDPGYKLDKTRQYCQPICSLGCGENQRHNCTEPEICACAKGYQLSDEGCQPVCDPDCGVGGTCREANTCECERGFQLKDGVCQADCYQKCENGICYARNRCICNPGYKYHERSTYCVLV